MTFPGLRWTSWDRGHYGIAQPNQSIGSPSWPRVPLVQCKSTPLETYNSLGSSALDFRVGFKASGASGGYPLAPFWDCHGCTECAALQGRAGYNGFSTSHSWWRDSVLALSVSRSLLHNKQIPPTLSVFPLLTVREEKHGGGFQIRCCLLHPLRHKQWPGFCGRVETNIVTPLASRSEAPWGHNPLVSKLTSLQEVPQLLMYKWKLMSTQSHQD